VSSYNAFGFHSLHEMLYFWHGVFGVSCVCPPVRFASAQSYRMWGCLPSGYGLPLIGDHQAAIQPLLHFHPSMGVAGALQPRQELEGLPFKTYSVIRSHSTLVLEAKHSLQAKPRIRMPIGGAFLCCRYRKM